ncbi:retinol dehydrogenase 12 [Ixodes scapularis]|uniref:retinol dehydrogenase 12 n=1 Tax=Ixodes scapularis TaxID=6945 RepID=UPI001AA009A5|nr:retinol dehydrogenase 12 [Ixodes scapularis]XP_029844906.2 retinol dehydrogenase 12 [Ixodes scapularis]
MSPIEWLSATAGKVVFGTTTALCGLAALLFGIFAYNRLTLGRCKSKNRMDGKTVVITGANTGIGYETAKELASRGARVILGCRNAQKAEAAVNQLVADTRNSNISWKLLDTSSMESVRAFAMEVLKATDSIHVLINNAGIAGPKERCVTEEGLEVTFATNYLGHFLLTNLLLPVLKSSSPSRIISLSSVAYMFGNIDFADLQSMSGKFVTGKVYSNSKLATVLFTTELARRLDGTGVTANVLHPGVVNTPLSRSLMKVGEPVFSILSTIFGVKSLVEGAQTSIHLAVADEVSDVSGAYFVDCKPKALSGRGRDPMAATKLWEASCRLVGMEARDPVS